MPEPVVLSGRRGYAATVLAGLAGAGLTAVAGTRGWASGAGTVAGVHVDVTMKGADVAPLVGALGLVALAAWGVLLVTRGRMRRVAAVAGLLASLGALAAVVVGLGDAREAVVAALAHRGVEPGAATSGLTAWCYLAGAGALLAAAGSAVATLEAPSWPAMGSRYDAPGARAGRPRSEQDMWHAMDEGHDPTS
jgi:uncharacterized membrane protein (TIGR02234 family)